MKINAVSKCSNSPTDVHPTSTNPKIRQENKTKDFATSLSFKGETPGGSSAGKFLAIVSLSVIIAALYVLFKNAPKNSECKDGHLSCVG